MHAATNPYLFKSRLAADLNWRLMAQQDTLKRFGIMNPGWQSPPKRVPLVRANVFHDSSSNFEQNRHLFMLHTPVPNMTVRFPSDLVVLSAWYKSIASSFGLLFTRYKCTTEYLRVSLRVLLLHTGQLCCDISRHYKPESHLTQFDDVTTFWMCEKDSFLLIVAFSSSVFCLGEQLVYLAIKTAKIKDNKKSTTQTLGSSQGRWGSEDLRNKFGDKQLENATEPTVETYSINTSEACISLNVLPDRKLSRAGLWELNSRWDPQHKSYGGKLAQNPPIETANYWEQEVCLRWENNAHAR